MVLLLLNQSANIDHCSGYLCPINLIFLILYLIIFLMCCCCYPGSCITQKGKREPWLLLGTVSKIYYGNYKSGTNIEELSAAITNFDKLSQNPEVGLYKRNVIKTSEKNDLTF